MCVFEYAGEIVVWPQCCGRVFAWELHDSTWWMAACICSHCLTARYDFVWWRLYSCARCSMYIVYNAAIYQNNTVFWVLLVGVNIFLSVKWTISIFPGSTSPVKYAVHFIVLFYLTGEIWNSSYLFIGFACSRTNLRIWIAFFQDLLSPLWFCVQGSSVPSREGKRASKRKSMKTSVDIVPPPEKYAVSDTLIQICTLFKLHLTMNSSTIPHGMFGSRNQILLRDRMWYEWYTFRFALALYSCGAPWNKSYEYERKNWGESIASLEQANKCAFLTYREGQ